MNISELRSKFRDRILHTASKCGIVSVKVFGSTVRGDATEKSDVDFLISIKEKTSLLDVGSFQYEMEELLHTKVDIAFEGYLHKRIANHVIQEAQLL